MSGVWGIIPLSGSSIRMTIQLSECCIISGVWGIIPLSGSSIRMTIQLSSVVLCLVTGAS